MKTILNPMGLTLAMLLMVPSVSFGLGIETLQPVVSKPNASHFLVADDDDRPFWWRHGKSVWPGGDDRRDDDDDDDDDRWDDDDDD